MKKEAFIFLVIILTIQIVSAKINCSDGGKVIWDQNEVEVGSSRIINGLGVGLTKAAENNVIKNSNVMRRLMADLILDARRVELSNKSSSEEIEISTGKYTVSLDNSSSTTAKIIIEGESKEIEEGDVETIKNLFVMLGDLEESGEDAPKVKLIVGSKKLSLSSDEKPSEKETFDNRTYLVELISSSEGSNALIKVSTCNTGEIIEIKDAPQQTTPTNQTQNNTTLNTTVQSNQTNNGNESTKQVTVEEARERLKKLNETNSSNGTTVEKSDSNYSFFRRVINWFKKLFGFG